MVPIRHHPDTVSIFPQSIHPITRRVGIRFTNHEDGGFGELAEALEFVIEVKLGAEGDDQVFRIEFESSIQSLSEDVVAEGIRCYGLFVLDGLLRPVAAKPADGTAKDRVLFGVADELGFIAHAGGRMSNFKMEVGQIIEPGPIVTIAAAAENEERAAFVFGAECFREGIDPIIAAEIEIDFFYGSRHDFSPSSCAGRISKAAAAS